MTLTGQADRDSLVGMEGQIEQGFVGEKGSGHGT